MASLEILLAVEVMNRPFLYDKSHALYNNRVAIENAWVQIAIVASSHFENPIDCDEVKKHWKTLRDKYKRAKDRHDSIMDKSGGASTSSYFMKDELAYLNDHLIDRRKSHIKDKGPLIPPEPLESSCQLTGLNDITYFEMTNNQELKLENNGQLCENSNSTDASFNLKQPNTNKRKKKSMNKDINTILDYISGENESADEDLLFMRSLVPSLKLIKNSHTKSLVKMELMRVIHEGVFMNNPKIGDNNFMNSVNH